jgi:hypothetical protein
LAASVPAPLTVALPKFVAPLTVRVWLLANWIVEPVLTLSDWATAFDEVIRTLSPEASCTSSSPSGIPSAVERAAPVRGDVPGAGPGPGRGKAGWR